MTKARLKQYNNKVDFFSLSLFPSWHLTFYTVFLWTNRTYYTLSLSLASSPLQVDHWHAFRPVLLPREGLVDSGKPGQGSLADAARESATSPVPPQISPLPDRGQRDDPREQRLRFGPRHHVCLPGAGRRRDWDVRPGAGLLHPPGRRLLRGRPLLRRGEQLRLHEHREPRRSDRCVSSQPKPDFGTAVGRWHDGRHSEGRRSYLHWRMLQTVPGHPESSGKGCGPICSAIVAQLRHSQVFEYSLEQYFQPLLQLWVLFSVFHKFKNWYNFSLKVQGSRSLYYHQGANCFAASSHIK